MSVNKQIALTVIGLVVIAVIIWTVLSNRGDQELRQSTREAVVQLKAALDKGTSPEELHTLTDAIESAYTRKPGAFGDCGKTFTELQTHSSSVQSYWWSETYRNNGIHDLNLDCDILLTRLK